MRKLLYAFVFASILLLAGFTSFASENEPGGGGTLPPNRVWLPVVGMAAPCGVTDGEYGLSTDRYPPPGPYEHEIYFAVLDRSGFQDGKILVASDYLFENTLVDGGSFGGILPTFSIHLELSRLEAGQAYYAKMQYMCYGTPAQTPVLTFVAKTPTQP